MNRREILKLFTGTTLTLVMFPTLIYANDLSLFTHEANQDTIINNNINSNINNNNINTPYLVVGPYADDKYRIFMFISYLCEYCKQTLTGMLQWATTLPHPFVFVIVPIFVNDLRQKAAATGFYIVKSLLPQKIAEYNQLVFEKITSVTSFKDIVLILKSLGLNQSNIKQSLNDQKTLNRIKRSLILTKRYKVTATPFFSVAGKYTTEASLTKGNYQLLVQLLNGLISNEMAKNI